MAVFAKLTDFPLTMGVLTACVVLLSLRAWRRRAALQAGRRCIQNARCTSAHDATWWTLPFFVWALEGTLYIGATTWNRMATHYLVDPPFEWYVQPLVWASAPLLALLLVMTPMAMLADDGIPPWDRRGPERTAVVATIASFFLNAQAMLYHIRPWPQPW